MQHGQSSCIEAVDHIAHRLVVAAQLVGYRGGSFSALTSVYFHPASGTSSVLSIMPGYLPNTAAPGFVYDFEGTSSGAEIQVAMQVDSSGNWKLTPGSVSEIVTIVVAGWIDPL